MTLVSLVGALALVLAGRIRRRTADA
jgi:hypothetical protein